MTSPAQGAPATAGPADAGQAAPTAPTTAPSAPATAPVAQEAPAQTPQTPTVQPVAPAPAGPQAPPAQPAPAGPQDGGRSLDSQPAWVQKEVREAREEAARYRVEARTARVNNAVLMRAADLGVNPDALLGSTSWGARAENIDPSADDFAGVLEATVKAVLAEAPWVAAQAPATPTPTAPAAQSAGEFNGSPAADPVTPEQFAKMGGRERNALYLTNRTLYDKLAGR